MLARLRHFRRGTDARLRRVMTKSRGGSPGHRLPSGRPSAVVDPRDETSTERALEQARSELAEAQRLAHVGSWTWDIASDTTVWSEELFRIYGIPLDRPAPDAAERAAHYDADTASRLRALVAGAITTGEPYETEYDVHRSDGAIRHVLARGEPIHDAMGAVIGVRGTAIDISAQHEARAALRASEERYRLLVDNGSDVVFLGRPDTTIEWISPSVQAILGWEPAQVIGRPALELIDPADRPYVKAQSEGINDTGAGQIEARYRHADGGVRHLSVAVNVVRDAAGDIVARTGIGRDVTDLRLAESAVRDQARLIDLVDDAIIVRDPESRVLSWSAGAEKTYGWTVAEATGRVTHELLRTVFPIPLAALEASVETSGEWRGTLLHQARDGRTVIVDSRWTLDRDAAGDVRAMIEVNRDVTDLRKAEAAYLDAQARLDVAERMEMIGRLAGGVAHDFNNLLMTINGYAESLAGTLSERDERRRDVDAILAAGSRAAGLTRQLLAFGRRQQLRPTVVDLDAVLEGILPMLRSVTSDLVSITVRTGAAGAVRVDRTMLEQAIMSLVLNAGDAMPAGGRLIIESTMVPLAHDDVRLRPSAAPGDFVRLSISDTGSGITEDVLPHVFEPFFTTKSLGHGAGLGLSSVDGAIAQSGGFLTVETEVDRGSTFAIYLPLVRPGPFAPEPSDEAQADDRRVTVLVVDDEPGVLAITARILRGLGHMVVEAPDPASALARLEGGLSPDLLVTDVVMPGMHGRALADLLARARPGVPVLYMSGYAPETVFADGMLEEGAVYLEKPFSRDDLVDKVTQLLDRRSMPVASSADSGAASEDAGSGAAAEPAA